MSESDLLRSVKEAVRQLEPEAEIILYGSRSRGDARPESDWDFLVLVDGPVDDARADAIRRRLYEIEWEGGEVLCAIVRSREEWNSPLYRAMPFRQNVEGEGVVLQISGSKAAQIAGLTRLEFLDELARRRPSVVNISLDEIEEELARG